ncbi:2-dehydro-3-deoxy-D-gluconate 5-dehydrogenase KduD [Streptobacillus moniliformis]|uniref:2-deoxy-D-gluconate 3-dehydrogenase n=1 Tax=Streptobacillus moniliformis (strain ATCC 14647 / DSM 12112 / NCTC 10651 / 9901) TaxID=519441 RepID=D1AWD5_STRM9|nr:2-dehydro-3-deoxy-D-gluconate 5-dehydrogenase KduD [Streptobacillus moniliformis]ACZ00611.1 2-deoxy-D-gluconate 3-dehydrogenase [Streptobacillus moniliformis DSM 12112]SQA14263.1 2-dehydro-3-deoxy-D-gluconate 5-dehydrogenase [Streptobacillus moniliformis]
MNKFLTEMFSLDGKVAIVTGGNTGLGLAYSKALMEAGADLLISTFDDNVSEVIEEANRLGKKVVFVKGDLTKKEIREEIVKQAIDEFGKIDILVNNAGTIRRAPLLEYSEEDWNAVMDINLNALYFLSQRVAKVMVEQGYGKIVNIASMLSFQGGKFVPPYTASKHGVMGLTRAFANELAEKNIQINAIAPGYIKTANTQPIRDDVKRNQEILNRIPAGRWGETDDLMGAVVFLSSKASDYINGHVLAVDGAWLSR